MIDALVCLIVGLVGFFGSYGVWQAMIEQRIVRRGPPKRAARVERERKAHRRSALLLRRRGAVR